MARHDLNGDRQQESPPRVALVTGAASGLGAATAGVFREDGFAIAALDICAPETVMGDQPDPPLEWWMADVRNEQQIARAVEEVVARFGRIDVAVNCAGVDHTYWIEDMTIEQFDQVLGVNLRGPFLIAKAVWPVMQRHGGGHIVNVASTAGLRAWCGASAYHASKFGLIGLSRGLNVEGRKDGISVTTIIPGGMRTHFFDRFVDQGIPLPAEETLQDPRDVARAILFAATSGRTSVVQELIVTPPNETSWP